MGAVTTVNRTIELIDELLPIWQSATKTEDAAALIARSAVDALLDLRAFATEFNAIDVKTRTAA